jgi:hypothetical protein
VNAVRVGVIDQRRLAGLLVNQVGRKVVFAANEDFLARELCCGVGAIGDIHEAAIRVHMHGASGLP